MSSARSPGGKRGYGVPKGSESHTDGPRVKRAAPLTRAEILGAALAIVDAEGLDALTMRRLAADLGVEAMSLYYHVASKEALLDGVVETVLAEMELPAAAPEDWMDLLESMLLSFRRALADHPNAIPILVARPLNTSVSASYVEAPVRALGAAGFSPAQTGEAYQSLIAYSFGHALISSLAAPPAAETSPLKAPDAAERFPATVALDGAPRRFDEDGFKRAVRILMRGYAQEAGFESG
jgi:AcrR family transcriptional regulator